MPNAPKVLALAEPRDAQFVMASWSRPVLLATNLPLFQKVRRSLQNSPGK